MKPANLLPRSTQLFIKTFLFLILATLITLTMPIFIIGITETQKFLGIKTILVPVEGTGSMYPSLYWSQEEGGPNNLAETSLDENRLTPPMYKYFEGLAIGNQTYFTRELFHGDMIAFKSDKTRAILEAEGKDPDAGFIKRIIGLPGDIIEIRDGFVLRNSEQINEPYIYKPRSTYGGTQVADCQQVIVPEEHVFVFGDNRKVSSDSRYEVGMVAFSDINFVLPMSEQAIYQDYWRDTTEDAKLAHRPTLNRTEFYSLLNAQRSLLSAPALQPNSPLNNSSTLRAQKILSTNDASIEATRSGHTMARAMADAGYSNIIKGEIISTGYYTAEELLQNLLHFPSTSGQVLDSSYQEIGISVINGELNSCPTQVIVGHFGGYLPADYSEDSVESWKDLRDNLNNIIPSWEEQKGKSYIDPLLLTQLLDILYTRRDLAREIYDSMNTREWLSDAQKSRIEADHDLAKSANEIINKLNNP